MPISLPVAMAIMAATTAAAATGSAVMQNQQIQHAKGAAQANQTAMNAQIKSADDQAKANQKNQSQTAQGGAAQKMAAALASMTSTGGMSGTITGASGMIPAQTQQKTLLGA